MTDDVYTPTASEVISLFEKIVLLHEKAMQPEDEIHAQVDPDCNGVDLVENGNVAAHFHLSEDIMALCDKVADILRVTPERIMLILAVHVLQSVADEDTTMPEGVTLQ